MLGVVRADHPDLCENDLYTPAINKLLNNLVGDGPTEESFKKVVQRVTSWLPARHYVGGTLWNFQQAYRGIDFWGIQNLNHTALYKHARVAFLDHYAHALLELPQQEVMNVFAEAAAASKPDKQLLALVPFYTYKLRMQQQLQGKLFDLSQWHITPQENAEITACSRDVLAAILDYSAYAVKPCFLQDGFFHGGQDVWTISDGPTEIRTVFGSQLLAPSLLAIFGVLPKSELPAPNAAVRVADNPTTKMLFGIHADGGLYTDWHRYWPIEVLFGQAGRIDYLPLFRLVQLLRLHDLVVPEMVHRTSGLPAWPTLPEKHKEREAFKKQLPTTFRKLWLPRKRYIESVAAKKATSASNQRQAPAEVVGFFRKLPKGHTASERAKAVSLEERGKLPPAGQTYVRDRNATNVLHEVRRRSR